MFTKNTYLIKEQFKLLKIVDRYDIFDPETGKIIAYAKENISNLQKALRFIVKKNLLPTYIEIKSADTNEVFYTLRKPFAIIRPYVYVTDAEGKSLGYFKSKILTLGGSFDVFVDHNQLVAKVKGNWSGWTFKFTDANGKELGLVTKKWAGIGKEFFTNSDTYVVSLNDGIASKELMALLVIAGLAIDVVYKEKQ